MGTTATPLSSVLEVIEATVAGFHSRGFATADDVKKNNPRSAARVFMVPPNALILDLNHARQVKKIEGFHPMQPLRIWLSPRPSRSRRFVLPTDDCSTFSHC